ncbi:MAG TPA: peptidase E [Bryobacteraceae bacterium]
MRKTIIAIGGGKIARRGTESIDREIIRRTGKKNPRLLFLPTASSDSEEYGELVQKYFGGFLKCNVDVLYLMKEKPSTESIRQKIEAAEIIYVGGGNTLQMMRIWRRLGVDKMLRAAYERGTVLAGLSAGAICWFEAGHSDSMAYFNPKKWEYIKVKGLGLVRGTLCPHYNSTTLGVPRRKHFRDMMQKTGGVGIALENNCAIEILDGRYYKVLSSKAYARAYKLYKSGGEVVAEQIRQEKDPAPVEALA